MLKIKNKSNKEAEIYISGDIVDDMDGEFYKGWGIESGYDFPSNIRQQLDELKGKDLTIYINSDGGYVHAGVAMANMIARHDGHTTAVVDGWCCSIATQIFFAANKQKMPTNAYLMIHKPSILAAGNADEMRKVAEILDTLQDGMETTYRKAARKGVTDEQIHDMTNAETWMTGAEAASVFNIELLEPVKAVACAGSGKARFRNIPDAIQFETKPLQEPERAIDRSAEELAKAEIEIALAKAKGAMLK